MINIGHSASCSGFDWACVSWACICARVEGMYFMEDILAEVSSLSMHEARDIPHKCRKQI